MIFEKIKKQIVKNLIAEIKTVGAEEFELVGHKIIELLEGQRLVHHGLNKDYRPAAYTVDSFNQSGTVVGAYSVELRYFEATKSNHFKKIEKDLTGALAHCNGKINKLYLFSSQEEPESFRRKFNCNKYIKRDSIEKIIIYDAREIAKIIYEKSCNSPDVASFFCDFFPAFSLNFNNYEYYGKAPSLCKNHYAEHQIIEIIDAHFASHEICVLSGLSGSGKTQVAIYFLHSLGKYFDNYIWINGEDWPEDTSLSSIKRTRGGIAVNVAGMFNSAKTLLIIDNLTRIISRDKFNELHNGFTQGGKVLITSQLMNNDSIYLSIPEISTEIAFKILGEEQKNSSDICCNFVERCKFLPLILATTRDILLHEEIDHDELYAEILNSPAGIIEENGQAIMEKLLSRLSSVYKESLIKIADSNVFIHDIDFLDFFIGINCRIALVRLGLLKCSHIPRMLIVHELICKAIQKNPGFNNISDAIDLYIDKFSGDMRPSVLKEIHVCAEQLRQANDFRGERDPDWITYALLQIDGAKSVRIIDSLSSKDISDSKTLKELLCIVDSKEIYGFGINDIDRRFEFYEKCALEFLNAKDKLQPQVMKLELLHHAGKAFRRCRKYRESFQCFKEILEIDPKWHAALAQIATLGTLRNVDAEIKKSGCTALKKLFEYIFDKHQDVPLRVSLAAISRLRSYRYSISDIIDSKDKIDSLANVIALSALDGLYQFYESFYCFISIFGYDNGDICIMLAKRFPELFEITPDDINGYDLKLYICESLVNIIEIANQSGDQYLAERSKTTALKFVDALQIAGINITSYTARAIARAYVACNEIEKALDFINALTDYQCNHWILYIKSKAELKMGKYDQALDTAIKASALAAKDIQARDRISIYHALLANCYINLNENDLALNELNLAIDECANSKYKKELILQRKILDNVKGDGDGTR